MSILIKGMEMPECGYVCLKVFANGEVLMTKEHRGALVITGIREKVGTAVPVPAHGDLIDVSTKVTVQIYDDMYEEFHDEECTIADVLDRWSNEGCPEAIIPASGGKEDE